VTDLASTTSFGYWVRRRRLALDLTQADLAHAVSCATVTITKIERDERRASRQLALLLAERLAIPAVELERFLAVALGKVAVDHLLLDGTPLTASAAPGAPPSNLPTTSTPFVGRHSELSQLTTRLANPACRLLTLLGAGGFGKTRLAIRLGEVAVAQPDRFPDGIFFVALDGLDGGEYVVPAIAAALRFTFYEQERQETQLLRYIAGKRLLLILDNAEGILDPGFIARILGQAPGVKIVVTSREALNLQQEWLHPIAGMDVTRSDAGEHPQHQHADAIALFQQCAQRAQAGFDLDRELSHVQRICHLVDGAPLAIELAAAWLKVLTCEQVARELAHSIDFLATSMRDVSARHSSMRAVLAQSWQQLAADEQRVFRRLSIFEGGFRLEAAQAVVDAPLRVLAGLVEKAMLHLGQDSRYRIHLLLRQLGAEQLAADPVELAGCRARHAAYFMAFLAERRTALTGPGQMDALRDIQVEMDNIRAAWSYLAAQGPLTALREALPALFRFLWMRGRYVEGTQLVRQALEHTERVPETESEMPIRIALMVHEAQFAAAVGAYQPALSLAERALAESRRIGSKPEEAQSLYVLGMVYSHLGRSEEAVASLSVAYRLFQALDALVFVADTALLLAFIGNWMYDNATALKFAEEGLALYQQLGDRFDMADGLSHVGWLRWYAGDVAQAERLYQDCRSIAEATENRLGLMWAIGGLGLVALTREQWDLAIALQHARLDMAVDLGHEGEMKSSMDLTMAAYLAAERYADAHTFLASHPEIRHIQCRAQINIGVGEYQVAMTVLQRTPAADMVASREFPIAWVTMVAWAMLLTSDCEPLMLCDGVPPRRLARNERDAMAVEILTAVVSFAPTDPASRAQAIRLRARLSARTGIIPSPPTRSLQELAGMTRSIQLG
jgi:predicted ATPase/transcriptional regulator with XRE-family HTH domain